MSDAAVVESAVHPEAAGPRRYELVVVAGAVGGMRALETILSRLPPEFPLPIAVVQHPSTALPNLVAHVIRRHTRLRVKLVRRAETMQPGTVYIAPPNRHMIVEAGAKLALRDGRRIRHVLSSANPLFESAAEMLGERVIALVLSGGDSDATDGVQTVHRHGGTVLAQDEATAQLFDMPRSAIATGAVDRVLPLHKIAPALMTLAAKERRSAQVDPRQHRRRSTA